MCSHLPLDDQLNRVFYIDGALFRLVYQPAKNRCVLHREARNITFDHAVALIGAGELLWSPPENFERLDEAAVAHQVKHEHALLCAFLLSPAARRITRMEDRSRLVDRLIDDDAWLARHAMGTP